MHPGGAVIVTGKEDAVTVFLQTEPGAAGAVTASSPDAVKTARQREGLIGKRHRFENDRVIYGKGELTRSFRGEHHTSVKPVGKQAGKCAGLVFMGMGNKEIAGLLNLFRTQMRQFIPAIGALIAAVENKRQMISLHDITVPFLGARGACQIKPHAASCQDGLNEPVSQVFASIVQKPRADNE